MAILPDYTQGSITLTSGSKDFTTSDSALVSKQVRGGDMIYSSVTGLFLLIDTITGENSGTLAYNCPAAAAVTDGPLRIRLQPDVSRYTAALYDVLDKLKSGNVDALAGLIGSAGKIPQFTGAGTMQLADYLALNYRSDWATGQAYNVNDIVKQSGDAYICLVAHTSGTFVDDLAAGKWDLFVEKGEAGTGDVSSTDTDASTFGFVLDEDNMASDSATKLPTQRSVKAFASNPANSTFLQSGTGAVWRTVKAKLKDAYITPADFGAKFDCVSLTDASVTSGSATLTSATASFSNDDVGKTIVVEKGGTSGAALTTTIASVESGTSLTLATNAVSTAADRATYGTLDTAAVQQAIDFCCSAGLTLQFPAGRCFSEAITATDIVSWIGAGQGTSQIIFTGDNGITYTGGNDPRLHPSPAVYAKEIGFITAADANNATAVLDISFSGQWTAIRSVELESVRVQGLKDGGSFAKGISLFNCSNFVLDKPEVINANPVVSGTYGIFVDGDKQPVDMYIRTPQVRFCDEGIHINSRVDGQGLEGISILGGAVLFCNTCIKANSSAAQPYVQIANVNTNAYENNIVLSNFINLAIYNNLYYGAKKTPNPATYIALQINNSDAALGINCGNVVSGNCFYGLNDIGTTAKQGITINGSNGANTQTHITGNTFDGYDFGVILYAGANNVIIDDTNVFAGCTTDVSYQSTSGSASVFKRRPLGNGEQHIVAEQIVVSSSDFTGQNVSTAQPVFASAQDTLTIASSTTYEFEAEYEIDNTGTTSRTLSILFALGSGASLTGIAYTALTTNAANASAPQTVSMTRATAATAVAITSAVASATQNTIRLRGTLRVNAGGTITPQFQYSAAPGAAPTVKSNSFFRLWPIGSNTVTTVGPWA